jgi:peptidoglycan hydrolase-like protein with peptidoglycan-binding domain
MALTLSIALGAHADDTNTRGDTGRGSSSAADEAAGAATSEEGSSTLRGSADPTGATRGQPGQASDDSQAAADTEPAEGLALEDLSPEQVKELQRSLEERGQYSARIDGIVGPKTRAALRNYQQQQGLQGDGMFTRETADALGIDYGAFERQAVRGVEAEPKTGAVGSTMQAEQPQTWDLANLGSDQARQLQTKLQELGFYKGEIDGAIGPMTRTALQQYFRDQVQLAANGKISEVGLASLGMDSADIQRTRGVEEEGTPTTKSPSRGVMPPLPGEQEHEGAGSEAAPPPPSRTPVPSDREPVEEAPPTPAPRPDTSPY